VLSKLNVPVKLDVEYADALCAGSEIVLWAMFSRHEDELDTENPIILGADSLGERGKRAEIVGEEAAKKLLGLIESKAPVDSHTADNLVPFIAVFGGEMKVSEITNHLRTNVYVVEQFFGKCIEIDEKNKTIRKILSV
jgi:RNA 3'-terminal phosphate cyclase (GTP)